MSDARHPRVRHVPRAWRDRLGGSAGNETLTAVNAVLLVVLLAVQGITVLALGTFIRIHRFVGVVLLGPVALKLATTGYRFARYYTGAREYRAAGPPSTLLRVVAPVFVAATIALFASGVTMLIRGNGEGGANAIHQASFWVWLACLSLHVLLNAREVASHVRSEWLGRTRLRLAGAELRPALVLSSVLGGVLLALALISKITGFDFESD